MDEGPFLAATKTPILFQGERSKNETGSGNEVKTSDYTLTFRDGELHSIGIDEKFTVFNNSIISEENPKVITSIIIEGALIDAPEFSKAIQNLTNLKSLFLINVTIVGDFERIYLPNLITFFIDQYTDMTDYHGFQEKIYSILFF